MNAVAGRSSGVRGWLVLALVLLLGGRPWAQIQDFDGKREAARAGCVTQLEEYSEWCKDKKLFLSRKRALDLLLALVPDHEEAHKALGFKRGRNGVWTPPRRPKKFKNFKKEFIEEAEERWEGVTRGYLEALHALLGDADCTRDQRLVLFEDILFVDPDDAQMRAARGEVRSGEAWVLEETLVAQAARRSIAEAIQAGRGGDGELEVVVPNRIEEGLGLHWTKVYQGPVGRVLGTAPEEELRNVARALSATMAVYRHLFGESRRPPTGLTVFVLGDPDERTTFLNAYPGLPDEDRVRMAEFTSTWIDNKSHGAVWMESPEERVDCLVRLFLSKLMARDFRFDASRGWIHEGLGLYIAEAVLGTRLTWFVQPPDTQTPDGESMRRVLMESSAWLDEAGRLFVGAGRPRVGALVEKPLQEFTLQDVLHAYAFGAYLIEGHGPRVAGMARLVGAGRPGRAALEEALGRSVGELDERFLRWMAESGHAAGG